MRIFLKLIHFALILCFPLWWLAGTVIGIVGGEAYKYVQNQRAENEIPTAELVE